LIRQNFLIEGSRRRSPHDSVRRDNRNKLFSGRVLLSGVDTQTVDQNGVGYISALCVLESVDKTGGPCRIFIDNNGWFSGEMVMPFKTIPTLFTDSKSPATYLHTDKFRPERHPRQGGVIIKYLKYAIRNITTQNIVLFQGETNPPPSPQKQLYK
jgi:hypothetical protein